MTRVIMGFLLGVVVTLAAVYWLDATPPEMQTNQTDRAISPEESAEAHRAGPVKRSDEAVEVGGEDSYIPTSAEPGANQEPFTMQSQSVAVSPQGAGSTSPVQRSSAKAANDQYPPEIVDMIDNRVDKELQARYENDEREESWATYMEGQLAAYFAQKPSLAQFHLSLIDCRTSICSIHVLGYGLDALTRWNSATADMVSQPWFEFNNMSMNRRNPEPGILAIVLILTKEPPD